MQLVVRAGLKLGATEMQIHSSNHLARLPPPGDIHCRSITLTPLIFLRVLLYTGFIVVDTAPLEIHFHVPHVKQQ